MEATLHLGGAGGECGELKEAVPPTFTSMTSLDSGFDANPGDGMNLTILNVCLEASFFERECAPKTTLKDEALVKLKNQENRSNEMIPKCPSGEARPWRRQIRAGTRPPRRPVQDQVARRGSVARA